MYDTVANADIWSGPFTAFGATFPVQFQLTPSMIALADCPPLPNWTITEASLRNFPPVRATFPQTDIFSPTVLLGAGLGLMKFTFSVAILYLPYRLLVFCDHL